MLSREPWQVCRTTCLFIPNKTYRFLKRLASEDAFCRWNAEENSYLLRCFSSQSESAVYENDHTTCNLELDISCYDIYIINSNFNYRNRSLLLKGLKGHSDKIESGEQRCPLPFHFLNKSKLKQRPI